MRIERWRRRRTKRTAMPEDLWAVAVSLVEERGVYAVSQALKLSHDRLKLNVLQAELAGRGCPSSEPGFVELSAGEVLGAAEAAGSEIEFSSADGAQMTIRLPAGQAVDVVGLSDAFWRRG